MNQPTDDELVTAVEPADDVLANELRMIMGKVTALLKEHDCAAFIALAKPGGAEVKVTLDTTWSCARISDDGAFTMTTKGLAREDKPKAVAETANVLHALADISMKGAVELVICSEHVDSLYDFTHGPAIKIPKPEVH